MICNKLNHNSTQCQIQILNLHSEVQIDSRLRWGLSQLRSVSNKSGESSKEVKALFIFNRIGVPCTALGMWFFV